MKKSDKMILAVYVIFGIILAVIGIISKIDYYSPMIFAMGVGLSFSGIMQLTRFYRNTKPENIEAYHEKLRQQAIDLKDERKLQLRNRSGYITWAVTMVFFLIASVSAALFRAGAVIVLILAGAAVVEYVIATIIYKYLCSKM